jgi:hypothetical protein
MLGSGSFGVGQAQNWRWWSTLCRSVQEGNDEHTIGLGDQIVCGQGSIWGGKQEMYTSRSEERLYVKRTKSGNDGLLIYRQRTWMIEYFGV